jgi:hypothetical protein
MLSSIHPLGERAKNNRWGLTATAFVMGSVAGGLVAGGTAGIIGELLDALWGTGTPAAVAIAAAVLAIALGFDLQPAGVDLPGTRRQVDENWLNRYRGWVYGTGYGVQLGLGVVTIVNTAAVYAAMLLATLSGSVVGGLIIGGAFGAVRGSFILAGRRITTPERLISFHRALDGWARRTQRLAPITEAAVLVLVAGTVVTGR